MGVKYRLKCYQGFFYTFWWRLHLALDLCLPSTFFFFSTHRLGGKIPRVWWGVQIFKKGSARLFLGLGFDMLEITTEIADYIIPEQMYLHPLLPQISQKWARLLVRSGSWFHSENRKTGRYKVHDRSDKERKVRVKLCKREERLFKS